MNAMFILIRSVRIALQSFIAAVVVLQNAYHTTGSVNGVYEFGCELHRKRIECAIMLKVAEAEENLKVEY